MWCLLPHSSKTPKREKPHKKTSIPDPNPKWVFFLFTSDTPTICCALGLERNKEKKGKTQPFLSNCSLLSVFHCFAYSHGGNWGCYHWGERDLYLWRKIYTIQCFGQPLWGYSQVCPSDSTHWPRRLWNCLVSWCFLVNGWWVFFAFAF